MLKPPSAARTRDWLLRGLRVIQRFAILKMHGNTEEHSGNRQGHEHHLSGDVQPTVVENYPDGPGPLKGAKFQERFRGVHVLQRDENGLEKCVACFLCAAACPSNCIYIEAAENTAENRVSGAERYAKVYNIDYNRCIFCGYCVEACPTDAITHGHGFELATFNASSLVYRKEQMLAAVPAHMGANAVFNAAEVQGAGAGDPVPGR